MILAHYTVVDLLWSHKLWVPPWSRRPKQEGREERPEAQGPDDKVPPGKGKTERRKPNKGKRRGVIPDGLMERWGGAIISRILSTGLYR